MELMFKQSKAVAVTSMSFPLGDVNNFVVGSEDGSVYMSCRHGRCVPRDSLFVGPALPGKLLWGEGSGGVGET